MAIIPINRLSATDQVTAGDLLAVFQQSSGDARKASMNVLLDFMQGNLDFTAGVSFTTQYSAPSSSGFVVAVTDDGKNYWLVLTPTAASASGTITLPASPGDKQEVLINCTQAVTALTVSGGTNTVTGAPTALVANDRFLMKFEAVSSVWYRVG